MGKCGELLHTALLHTTTTGKHVQRMTKNIVAVFLILGHNGMEEERKTTPAPWSL